MLAVLPLLLAAPQATATPPLAPAAAAAFATWRTKAAACEAPLTALPKGASVAASLAVRVEAEQCLRRRLGDPLLAALAPADRRAVMTRAWAVVLPVDAANTGWLKTVIPADGWFRASRDGAAVAHDAWLIVQHSPDPRFQAAVLARMEPLARRGEVKGGDYALLYDRVEMAAGRPQYYGSQYRCQGGRWSPYPIRDPAAVESRRAALGMSGMADNLAQLAANGGC